MAATLATRKPIDQITVADLVDFPIWEFCLDEEGVEGMDETWVRPLAAAAVPNGAYSLSVAAEFETASGLRVNGLIGVTTAEGEVEIAYPVLLFNGKYLFVPESSTTCRSVRTMGSSAGPSSTRSGRLPSFRYATGLVYLSRAKHRIVRAPSRKVRVGMTKTRCRGQQ